MKKMLLVCILTILLALSSCTNEPQEVVCYDPVIYFVRDMDAFFEDLVQCRAGTLDSNHLLARYTEQPSDIEQMIIPVVKSDKYGFYQVEVDEDAYRYYFMPIDAEGNVTINHTDQISIYVSKKDNTFAGAIKQLELTVVGNKAYDSDRNSWYINNNGRRISIDLPDSLIIDNTVLLYKYFDFEKYAVDADGVNKID